MAGDGRAIDVEFQFSGGKSTTGHYGPKYAQ
jgi:hypothetical protein